MKQFLFNKKQLSEICIRRIEETSIQRMILFSKFIIWIHIFLIFVGIYNGYNGLWEQHPSQFYMLIMQLFSIPIFLLSNKGWQHYLKSGGNDFFLRYESLLILTIIVYIPTVISYYYIALVEFNMGGMPLVIYFFSFGNCIILSKQERILLTVYFFLLSFSLPLFLGISYYQNPYLYMIISGCIILFYLLSKTFNHSEIIRFIQEDSLEKKNTELKQLNQKLNTAYTEIKSINLNLAESNRNLENFAYIAAHDIKAPLRTINGFTKILAQKYTDKIAPDDIEFFDLIESNVANLSNLVNQLLEFSKVPQKSKIKKTSIPLNIIINECKKLVDFEISKNNVVIHVQEIPPVVYGNISLLKQLFLNLFNNAIKFSKHLPQPTITIGFKLLPNQLTEISISDNGIGINPEHHHTIFELFKKLHSAYKYEGTGIGLAFCKKIVMAHSGQIWVESQEGTGAKFIFTLPLSSTHSQLKLNNQNEAIIEMG